MDTQTDIMLAKIDENGYSVKPKKAYSLLSFLNGILQKKAILRFAIGKENNEVRVLFWDDDSYSFIGKTERNADKVNKLLGYHLIGDWNTYL